MAEDAGFLSRWARRKAEVKSGKPVPAELFAPAVDQTAAVVPAASLAAEAAAVDAPPVTEAPAPPLPTLDDVASLVPGDEISRFVARGVDENVKRAAIKKLFTDPHYNVMDGLDIYIDDYSLPDPIPMAMLRQMNQSKFMGLFAEEDAKEEAEEAEAAAAAARAEAAASPEPLSQDAGAAQAAAVPQTPMKTLICNCNQTMTLDGPALQRALGPTASDGLELVHTLLCRREAAAFQRAAKSGEELLVACTQEQRLFLELNDETEGAPGLQERPIRFVNIRETGGWSDDAKAKPSSVTPKIAALLAAAQLPEPEPVATVTYRSGGRCLVIGSADATQRAAQMLQDKLDVSLLLTAPGGTLPQARTLPVDAGRVIKLTGWLGAFEVSWEAGNPIDLDLCTRCNACIDVCPEGAIDFSYQIDLAKCTNHRDCVRACDAAGAIDFQRAPSQITEHYDLVLDLSAEPLIALHQPPQGYFHAPDDAALIAAALKLRELVGEFEKPKFFHYKQKLCAHSRNEREGCTACIDVCSAQAITSRRTDNGPEKGGIAVNPNLCVGCGACTTVCPSGALTYATPGPAHLGKRLRTMIGTYHNAGGADAALLLHSQEAGSRLIDALGRAARTGKAVRGLPARVMPVDVWHTASVGLDLWLAAIAHGASQVWVLMTDEEAPDYRRAVAAQMAVGQAILSGLGYRGEHLRLMEAADVPMLDAALRQATLQAAAQTVRQPASFAVQADKRATLELAIDHLAAQAPSSAEAIALPQQGSPFGSLHLDTDKCTMCLSCVGACPESALGDNPERPQLKFTEKNCVQCGLCVVTCPEDALALDPRLWLADGGKARKQPRVLHEVPPWACVKCGKPFGTQKAIEGMLLKLAGHSMFQGAALERLKMCGDCRVIDLHTNPNEVKITDL